MKIGGSIILLSFTAILFGASLVRAPYQTQKLSAPTPTTVPQRITITPTTEPKEAITQSSKPTTAPAKQPPQTGGGSASSSQIFAAINTYRQAHGLASVSLSSSLCSIAQTRAKQQTNIGHLSHDGFDAIAHTQTEFHHIAEILQWFPEPKSATYLVETGWDGSAPHRNTILDSSWTQGCAGVSGYYSVFIFASV